ncbi:glycoside hydrolase family 32 protein [Stieleria sp. TO1_6]|uniref:glycoside hydrolase family 32 protein n=1 Tax=Stieleria tagensis TaxID=2956795 RepID=UPI00209AC525|nr:glycoside hydrolase family 32 protein [Stieleria tagensis]MCO8122031.1 glycoside hydrolase family 32 protein [Stieleria tagensis]
MTQLGFPLSLLMATLLAAQVTSPVAVAEDVLLADFEASNYGDWQTTGTAFSDAPAEGTLPGQMDVSGYQGKRLVNSFAGGDRSVGTLTSPAFEISRDYIHFLIGGGGFAGKTCMQLIVDGKVVREATGPNTVSGGSETLAPDFWDARPWQGQTAHIVIVDSATGGWGHINVDQIVLSDRRPATRAFDREFIVDQDYLLIPIRNGAAKVKLEVSVNGKAVRRYDTELATDPNQVDWFAFFNLSEFRGQPASLSVSRATEEGFAAIRTSNEVPAMAVGRDEPQRPQLHFSQWVGWINDPNGMVYLDGEWHLYFQHNPVGWAWGNMTWGHAVSTDLVHWEQLPNCLFPGTMAKGACFSGGAVVDKQNTAGWKSGSNDVLVAFLTDTGAGESVVYSNDNGRTFTWYNDNPIVEHKGRDPKVVWFRYREQDTPLDQTASDLGGHWVMAVYDEDDQHGQNTSFHTSTDLKQWTFQSRLAGYFECPELFELAIDGSTDRSKWVTFAADGRYALGSFDGRTFTPSHEGKHQLHYGNFYASQTFENAPDGRRIQIGWLRGVEFKGEAFNQAFSIPNVLTLKTTGAGPRIFAAPVQEIERLRIKTNTLADQPLPSGKPAAVPVSGELFDITATFEIGDAKQVGLDIGGNRVVYDVSTGTWNGAKTLPTDDRVSLRVLVDRSLIEIWGNGGEVVISGARNTRGMVSEIKAFADGGSATLIDLQAHELKSIWKQSTN